MSNLKFTQAQIDLLKSNGFIQLYDDKEWYCKAITTTYGLNVFLTAVPYIDRDTQVIWLQYRRNTSDSNWVWIEDSNYYVNNKEAIQYYIKNADFEISALLNS